MGARRGVAWRFLLGLAFVLLAQAKDAQETPFRAYRHALNTSFSFRGGTGRTAAYFSVEQVHLGDVPSAEASVEQVAFAIVVDGTSDGDVPALLVEETRDDGAGVGDEDVEVDARCAKLQPRRDADMPVGRFPYLPPHRYCDKEGDPDDADQQAPNHRRVLFANHAAKSLWSTKRGTVVALYAFRQRADTALVPGSLVRRAPLDNDDDSALRYLDGLAALHASAVTAPPADASAVSDGAGGLVVPDRRVRTNDTHFDVEERFTHDHLPPSHGLKRRGVVELLHERRVSGTPAGGATSAYVKRNLVLPTIEGSTGGHADEEGRIALSVTATLTLEHAEPASDEVLVALRRLAGASRDAPKLLHDHVSDAPGLDAAEVEPGTSPPRWAHMPDRAVPDDSDRARHAHLVQSGDEPEADSLDGLEAETELPYSNRTATARALLGNDKVGFSKVGCKFAFNLGSLSLGSSCGTTLITPVKIFGEPITFPAWAGGQIAKNSCGGVFAGINYGVAVEWDKNWYTLMDRRKGKKFGKQDKCVSESECRIARQQKAAGDEAASTSAQSSFNALPPAKKNKLATTGIFVTSAKHNDMPCKLMKGTCRWTDDNSPGASCGWGWNYAEQAPTASGKIVPSLCLHYRYSHYGQFSEQTDSRTEFYCGGACPMTWYEGIETGLLKRSEFPRDGDSVGSNPGGAEPDYYRCCVPDPIDPEPNDASPPPPPPPPSPEDKNEECDQQESLEAEDEGQKKEDEEEGSEKDDSKAMQPILLFSFFGVIDLKLQLGLWFQYGIAGVEKIDEPHLGANVPIVFKFGVEADVFASVLGVSRIGAYVRGTILSLQFIASAKLENSVMAWEQFCSRLAWQRMPWEIEVMGYWRYKNIKITMKGVKISWGKRKKIGQLYKKWKIGGEGEERLIFKFAH